MAEDILAVLRQALERARERGEAVRLNHGAAARTIEQLVSVRNALAEAAREINCAGTVAHRIRVMRQEHAMQLAARRRHVMAEVLAAWRDGGTDSMEFDDWLEAQAR